MLISTIDKVVVMRRMICTIIVVALMAFASQSRGAITLNQWTLDLSGVGIDSLSGTFENINELTFLGIAHAHTDSSPPAAGSLQAVDGLLQITAFSTIYGTKTKGTLTGGTSENTLNTDFEFTVSFSVANIVTGITPNKTEGLDVDFTHLAGSNLVEEKVQDGILDLWIDTALNANTDPTYGGGGFEDGTKIASFRVLAGAGGDYNTATSLGKDRANFELIWAKPGVWFDMNGTDLSGYVAGGSPVLIAMTDSTFDGTPNPPFDNPVPQSWPDPDTGGFHWTDTGSASGFFGKEDGSAQLGVVPEPGSLVIWGVVTGLGLIAARRRRLAV